MTERALNQLIIAGLMLFGSNQAVAATPGLWDGVAAMPPKALQVPQSMPDQAPASPDAGVIEYIPLSPVLFDGNSAKINHEGQLALDAAVEYLSKHNNVRRILVEGHTDWKGSATYNDNLSDRRAEIVRNYLTIKGIDPNLISLKGKGEYAPVDINWSREGRQRNRHVSIYAVQIN